MVNTLSFGSLQRTTVSNPRGTGLGSFGIRDWEISLGCGKTYRDGLLSLGLAVKYIREDIDSFSAQSVAADIGGMADLSRLDLPVSLGLAFHSLESYSIVSSVISMFALSPIAFSTTSFTS